MRTLVTTAGLLVCSNVFMTFAWYAHLRDLRTKPLWVVIYMGQPLKLDFLWAALCLVGAVYFVFRP